MKKVKISTSCNWAGTDQEHEVEVEDNITEDDLSKMAYEYALEDHAPEGMWEWIDSDKSGDKDD